MNLPEITRSTNWWDYKIPPLLFLSYLLILYLEPGLSQALRLIAVVVISIASVASFGHIINDIFDITEDRLAGNPNAVDGLSGWQRTLLLLLFLLTGFLALLLGKTPKFAYIILAAIYLFPLLYSVPPLRLKERGGWGVFADALAVHALPALLVFSIFGLLPFPAADQSPGLILSAFFWQFFVGLRGILIHQVQSLAKDRRAGARTFAGGIGLGLLRQSTLFFIFPAELAGLLGLSLLAYDFAAILLWLVLGYIAFDLLWHWAIKRTRCDPVPFDPGMNIPLFDLYETILPLAAAGLLILRAPGFYWILLIHLILFRRKFFFGFRLLRDWILKGASPKR